MDNLKLLRHLLTLEIAEQVEIAAASDDYSQILAGKNRFLDVLINENAYVIKFQN